MGNKSEHPCFCWTWPSPVGNLLLIGNDSGLRGLNFQDGDHPLAPNPDWREQRVPFAHVIKQLEDYFSGRLRMFRVKLALQGTGFQLSVWQALKRIPFGVTASYGAIAKQVGNPRASRAVGAANGQNPVSIIVPCHRVIGKNGQLVGYGGGLLIKEALLDLERQAAKAR